MALEAFGKPYIVLAKEHVGAVYCGLSSFHDDYYIAGTSDTCLLVGTLNGLNHMYVRASAAKAAWK